MSKDNEATSDKHPPFHIELAQKVIENWTSIPLSNRGSPRSIFFISILHIYVAEYLLLSLCL